MALDLAEARRLLWGLFMAVLTHDDEAKHEFRWWLDSGEDEEDDAALDEHWSASTGLWNWDRRFSFPPEKESLADPDTDGEPAREPKRERRDRNHQQRRREQRQHDRRDERRRRRRAQHGKQQREEESPGEPQLPERTRRPPTPRPFACALPDCHLKVRFTGEKGYRRFGFLAAFLHEHAMLLVCRRRVPRHGGKGNRIDDFLLSAPTPDLMKSSRDRRAIFLGRHLHGLAVSDSDWRLMDGTVEQGEVVVNGLTLHRMKRWPAWDAISRKVFDAGCSYEQWR